jgi:hypothetical protein
MRVLVKKNFVVENHKHLFGFLLSFVVLFRIMKSDIVRKWGLSVLLPKTENLTAHRVGDLVYYSFPAFDAMEGYATAFPLV